MSDLDRDEELRAGFQYAQQGQQGLDSDMSGGLQRHLHRSPTQQRKEEEKEERMRAHQGAVSSVPADASHPALKAAAPVESTASGASQGYGTAGTALSGLGTDAGKQPYGISGPSAANRPNPPKEHAEEERRVFGAEGAPQHGEGTVARGTSGMPTDYKLAKGKQEELQGGMGDQP